MLDLFDEVRRIVGQDDRMRKRNFAKKGGDDRSAGRASQPARRSHSISAQTDQKFCDVGHVIYTADRLAFLGRHT